MSLVFYNIFPAGFEEHWNCLPKIVSFLSIVDFKERDSYGMISNEWCKGPRTLWLVFNSFFASLEKLAKFQHIVMPNG